MELFFVGLVVGLVAMIPPLELMRRGKRKAEHKVEELLTFLGVARSRYEEEHPEKPRRRNRDGTDIL